MTHSSFVTNTDDTIPVFTRWFGSWQVSVQRRALSVGELTQRYDDSASGWQQTVDRLGFPAAYESLLRQIIGEDTPSTVLDCGVGTGALSQALINTASAPLALTAVDVSPRMLEQAHTTLGGTNADVTVRQADVCALPFSDNTFDLVMTAHTLEHLPDPAAALAEMVRVLKPGGRLVACMTRRTLLGMWIHVKWHTHRVTEGQANQLLLDAGLETIESLSFESRHWCRGLSLASTGCKPL